MNAAIREVVLERLTVAARAIIAPELAEEPALSVFVPEMCRGLCLQIVQAVAGEELARVSVSYPDGWWQAFRQRWLPRWWLARYPVREKYFELVANGLYPKLSMPNQYGARVVLYRQEGGGDL